ncbi:UNKNOWN [Stylonychia lemnae]|uniref:Uncharacterized protein n=1 Tax=Stylonychia lemnae TaxID=5949 RepID=A0A077ZXC6_STYLE|nr:UNKNOWN [Stylonychia lemnae]|eukprot:CDW74211.1 UNKNOWN [Stylonychia lemnae]
MKTQKFNQRNIHHQSGILKTMIYQAFKAIIFILTKNDLIFILNLKKNSKIIRVIINKYRWRQQSLRKTSKQSDFIDLKVQSSDQETTDNPILAMQDCIQDEDGLLTCVYAVMDKKDYIEQIGSTLTISSDTFGSITIKDSGLKKSGDGKYQDDRGNTFTFKTGGNDGFKINIGSDNSVNVQNPSPIVQSSFQQRSPQYKLRDYPFGYYY